MSSSSLNKKNKYFDINNETDDKKNNSIIVFKKMMIETKIDFCEQKHFVKTSTNQHQHMKTF
jgi:hypothetical protein